MVELRPLDAALANRCAAWTFPAYRHLLTMRPGARRSDDGGRMVVRPIGLAAMDGDTPCGLVLGCLPMAQEPPAPEGEGGPQLLSVYVAPRARRRGISRALIGGLETEVRNAAGASLETVYMIGPPEVAYFERALTRCGWAEPHLRMLAYRGTVASALGFPWHDRYSAGDRLELFPWAEITDEEIEALRASDRASSWVAGDLRAWYYDRREVEPATSLGIRYDGHVVGWVLNHRVRDTLRFTCSFIRPDLARHARLLIAWTESIRRAHDAGFSRVTFTVSTQNARMDAFCRRWVAPFGFERLETRGAAKSLSEPANPVG